MKAKKPLTKVLMGAAGLVLAVALGIGFQMNAARLKAQNFCRSLRSGQNLEATLESAKAEDVELLFANGKSPSVEPVPPTVSGMLQFIGKGPFSYKKECTVVFQNGILKTQKLQGLD